MVEVVTDGLQGDSEQKLHHLLFFVARGQELANGFVFRITAFANKFSHQVHQSIELGIRDREVCVECRDNFWGGEEALRDGCVCRCAIIAVVL